MNTAPRILGSHAYFFRDGTDLTVAGTGPDGTAIEVPATASRTVKPAVDDTAWLDFGVVNNLGVTPESTVDEIYAPSPGTLELYDVIENKRKRTIKFECEELSFLSFELAFHSKPLSVAGGAYNPGSGKTVKGWIRVEQFDQDADDESDPVNTVTLYCHVKLDGELKADENHVKTSIQLLPLRSSLNAGTLIA
jgi:hypothetical protein